MKASKRTKDTRMVYATLYLTFDLHKGLKKYCRLNGFTIPTFIEKLILSWYQQNCKIESKLNFTGEIRRKMQQFNRNESTNINI